MPKPYKQRATTPPEIRFERFRNKDGPISEFAPELGNCHPWTGAKSGSGYGMFNDGEKMVGAHVFAYVFVHGPLPPGLEIDHLCRNTLCVRISHLSAVSHKENQRRGRAGEWGRSKTHCPSGHEYTEANTRLYREHRYCRACDKARVRAPRKRKKKVLHS